MELKEFIKEALIQLTTGVKEAQEECYKQGGLINPMLAVPLSNKSLQIEDKYFPITNVDFRIGLTESTGKDTKKGIGVFLSAVSLGAEERKDINHQTVTTIGFSVTVVLPYISRDGKYIPLQGIFH